MKLIKPRTPEIFMECYCDARNKPMRCEITKPQTASVISLWFWGLLAYPELYCEWPEHNQHSRKFSGVHGFLSLTVSPTKGVKGDPRRSQRSSIFPPPTPHPLSSRELKKALKLPPHRYLPTPTTFHFLPSPYIFAPSSPSSLIFQAISPSSLLCISPLF